MATILDGKALRDKRKIALSSRVSAFRSKPKLAIVQIGHNPESDVYIRQKTSFGLAVGCEVLHIAFSEHAKESEVAERVHSLSADPSVSGIIVQIPLPARFSAERIIAEIDPRKDIDGMHPKNISALAHNLPGIVPATTRGILTLLDEYGISIAGKKAVVIGRSALVGRPTALALLNRDATVTVCHSKTADLSHEAKSADILVVATGKSRLVGAGHVAQGATVIDVGISRAPDGKIFGDVDFEAVSKVAGAISPVPGGVGPMTVLSLFENLADAHEELCGKRGN